MKVDVSKSQYHESPTAREEFNKQEMKHLQLLLRRLRFLEAQVRESGGLSNPGGSGGAAFAEWEIAALEWIMIELGYLDEVSGNQGERR